MMQSIRLTGVLMAGLLLAGASQASAQGPAPLDRGYVLFNVGGQGGSHDLAQTGSFPIYDDTATFANVIKVGGGPFFEIGGGYRITGQLFGAISYVHLSDKADTAVTGSIPDPLRFDLPFRTVSGTASGLKHSENQVHFDAVWHQPITTSFDLNLFVGPTLFNVSQDVVTGISVAEASSSPPFTTVNLTGITTAEATESQVGFNIGADGTYMFTPRLGVGAVLRYTTGSVDLQTDAGKFNLDLGGIQFGVGARFRF